MNTKMKLLLGVSFALASTPAQAQVTVGNIGPDGVPIAVDNGGTTCAATDGDGNPIQDGYVLADTPAVGNTTTVVCTNQDVLQNYLTIDGGATTIGGDAAEFFEIGAAEASYETVTEQSQVFDVTVDPAVPVGPPVNDSSVVAGSEAVDGFSYIEGAETDDQVHHVSSTFVSGESEVGTGTQSLYEQTAFGSTWSETTGTATFDPDTGDVDYTATAGSYANQDIDGNTVGVFGADGTTFETSQNAYGFDATHTDGESGTDYYAGFSWDGVQLEDGTSSTQYGLAGVSTTAPSYTVQAGGPSYVEVNAESVVIHGGSSSTTVTVDDAGISVSDSTNGTTFVLDDAGNGTFTGDVSAVDGTFSGNIQSSTLNTTGDATIGRDLQVNRNLAVTGNSALTGTLTVAGLTSANGGIATNGATIITSGGAISTGAGSISTTSGNISTTSGDIVTVTGDVVAGNIRLDSATGRIQGVSSGTLASDVATFGQLTTSVNTLNSRIDATNARVTVLEHESRQAFQGVAMGFAMNAAPLNLANGEGGISFGAGAFEGEYAGAVRAQFVTESGFGLGANVGFSEDAVGGGVGASIKF